MVVYETLRQALQVTAFVAVMMLAVEFVNFLRVKGINLLAGVVVGALLMALGL